MSLVKWVQRFLQGRTSSLQVHEVEASITLQRVTPQGSLLSPWIFLLGVDPLLWRLLDCLSYADDILLWSQGKYSALHLHQQLHSLESWCKNTCMVVSPQKTSVWWFRRRGIVHELHLDSLQLHTTTELSFLGITFDVRTSFFLHLVNQIKRAKGKWGCIKHIKCLTILQTLHVGIHCPPQFAPWECCLAMVFVL